jgi:hypothetical protein
MVHMDIDLGPEAELVLGGIGLLFFLALFVVPLVIFTLLAIHARRNGSAARATAGVLGLLGAVCSMLLVAGGLIATFAGAFAVSVLLVLGLGLMATSIFSRGGESDPAITHGDVTAVPVKRTRPWSAIAAGVGAALVFAGLLRQSRIESRANGRTDGRSPPLFVAPIE